MAKINQENSRTLEFRVPKLYDFELLKRIEQTITGENKAPSKDSTVYFSYGSIPLPELLSNFKTGKFPSDSIEITRINVPFSGGGEIGRWTMNFVRQQTQETDIVQVTTASTGKVDLVQTNQFLYNIRRCLEAIDLPSGNEEETETSYSGKKAASEEVRLMNSLLLKSAKEYENRHADFFKRIENLRIDIEKERDEYRQKLEQEYQDKVAKLKTKEEDLNKRQASMDLQDSKSARRATRKELTESLKKNELSVLSKETKTKWNHLYWMFGGISIVSLLYLGFKGYFIAEALNSNSQADISEFEWISLSVSFVTFIVTAFYCIRVQLRYFNLHATQDLMRQRYIIDIDRSTWIVEMLLEFETETENKEVPEQLIDRLSRNLFNEPDQEPDIGHPIGDTINSLLGRSGKVQLKNPQINLEMSRNDQPNSTKNRDSQ